MKRNTSPYSVARDVQMELASEFRCTGAMHNRFFCEFAKYGSWHAVPEVPGSLSVSCVQVEQKQLYQVDASFRVSFAELDNRNELDYYKNGNVILMYKSAGGQQKVCGSKAHPLSVTISEPEGFDGYEIKLTGTQTHPETFI